VTRKSDDKKVQIYIFNDIFFIGENQKSCNKFEYEFMSISKISSTTCHIKSVGFDEIFEFQPQDLSELHSYWYEIVEKFWTDTLKETPSSSTPTGVESPSKVNWTRSNKRHSLSSLKGIDNDLIGKNEHPQSVVDPQYMIEVRKKSSPDSELVIEIESGIRNFPDMSLTPNTPEGSPIPSELLDRKSTLSPSDSLKKEEEDDDKKRRRSSLYLIKSIFSKKK
jgi:hypothetical protein